MSLLFFTNSSSAGASGDVATLPINDFTTQGFTGTVYSGVKFDNDGNIYERQAGGGWSSIGAWLLSGTASDFYIKRTIDTGSLTTDGGAGPLILSTDRIYDLQRTTDGEDASRVTFSIVDIGDSVVYANRTYRLNVIRGQL